MSVSPELLLSLSPAVLRDLVATFTGKKPTGSHDALARALFTAFPSKKLAAAFARIAPFSTRAGRLALLEAARASAAPADVVASIESLPHADVAATLLLDLERTTSPARRRALRRLFALASLRVARDLPERATYELLADAAPVSLDAAHVVALLRRAFGARVVDRWDAVDADGALRVALFLERYPETRLRRPAGKGPIAPQVETLVAADVVRVFDEGARVALTLAEPHLLPLYASALGLTLRPSITLRSLQSSRVTLAARGVIALDVVGARHRRPSDRRIEVRGPDALDPSDLGARTGYVDRATLRGTHDDGAVDDAFLQLPHRVEIADGPRKPAMRAALDAAGIFSPGALPDDARSLAPYEHGDWRWRAVVGDATFDRLCKAKLLVRTQSKHVATHEHRMHGAAYVVRDVPGEPELQYALAEDPALGARLVGPKDRVAWKLDERALAAAMMRDLGARPAPSPIALAGVLDLGVVALASGKLRVVYAMAEPPAGWVEAVRRAAGVGATPVVLVPRGHAGEATGMLEVELAIGEQLGAVRARRVLGRIAEALDLAAEVEPDCLYDEEVVLDLAEQRMWISGVTVTLSDKAWRYVEYVARSGGKAVTTKEIGEYVSRSDYPDVSARKTRVAVEKQIRRTLVAAGADPEIAGRIIASEGRLGVRFGVSVRILGAGSPKIGRQHETIRSGG